MKRHTPSYLTKRNDIYYFQMRVPKGIFVNTSSCKALVRRSTKTGNYTEALKIARKWWYEYMANNGDKSEYIRQTEEKADYLNQLYTRGKVLVNKLSKIDPNDAEAADDFIELELGSDKRYSVKFDREAIGYYQDNCKTEPNIPNISGTTVSKTDKRISKYLQTYIKENVTPPNAWAETTQTKYLPILHMFVSMMGDPFISELTPELIMEKYTSKLSFIPSRIPIYKYFKNKDGSLKNMDEIIEIGQQQQNAVIEYRTVYSYVSCVKSFLLWMKSMEYVGEVILTPFKKFKKPTAKQKRKRVPFSDDDLKLIFHSDDYQSGYFLYNEPAKHWIPLISLYTGARLGEICKLKLEDIRKDKGSGVWYFDIVDDPDDKTRNTKTVASMRQTPIHKDLIKLGFLRYFKNLKEKKDKSDMLFDGMQSVKGKWGSAFSSWFTRAIIKKNNITCEKRQAIGFHSFRSNLINFGKQKRLDKAVIHEITGHEQKHSSSKDYEQEFGLNMRQKELNKVKYNIDLAKIKAWK